MSNYNSNIPVELGWNDSVENDQQEYTLLPDGTYNFEVVNFEKARHEGSDKIPPCPKAILTLRVTDMDGTLSADIKSNLFLISSMEWQICAFFTSIGLRKRGERFVMNWLAVMNARGICKMGHRDWKGKDGTMHTSNQIEKYIDPNDEVPSTPAPKAYTPGKF